MTPMQETNLDEPVTGATGDDTPTNQPDAAVETAAAEKVAAARTARQIEYLSARGGFVDTDEIPELLGAYGFAPVQPVRFPFQTKAAPDNRPDYEKYMKRQARLIVLHVLPKGQYVRDGAAVPLHRWDLRTEPLAG